MPLTCSERTPLAPLPTAPRRRDPGRGAAGAIAEEIPVALLYNGAPHAVMLATPADLEDFALGFSLSEGVIAAAGELGACTLTRHLAGIELDMTIPDARAAGLGESARTVTGRSGCGLCGARTLEQAIRWPGPVAATARVTGSAIHRAFEELAHRQPLRAATGCTHAAGFATLAGEIVCAREDIGRHNALDKVIGALASERVDFAGGMLVVTSRASSEMVQKAATVGAPILAARAAPTALAIAMAETSGLALVASVRRESHTVHANAWRILDADHAS